MDQVDIPTFSEVLKELIAAIQSVMEECTGESFEVNEFTRPFSELPDFDSLRAISTIFKVESALKKTVDYSAEPFSQLTNQADPSVRALADALNRNIRRET